VTLPRVPAERSESRDPEAARRVARPFSVTRFATLALGPGSRSARARALAALARDTRLRSAQRLCRSARLPIHDVKQRSLLRSRGAFSSAGSSLPLSLRIFHPEARGGGAPEAGHWHFRRACEARRLASRATGGRLSALQRGDFRLRDQRFIFRQCPPESAPRLRPRPGARARPIGSRASRDDGSLRATGRHFPAQPSRRLRRRPA
jgi:hypothetical protein